MGAYLFRAQPHSARRPPAHPIAHGLLVQVENLGCTSVQVAALLFWKTPLYTVVDFLSGGAESVMVAKGVPVLDLYTLVTDHCGAVPYEDCDWCRKHPCSYHYNPQGETPQAAYIAGTIRTMIAEPPTVVIK